MKKGDKKEFHEFRKDSQGPASPITQKEIFPDREKMATEDVKEYLDDLFRSYIFGEG